MLTISADDTGLEREVGQCLYNFVITQFSPFRKHGIDLEQIQSLQNLSKLEKRQIGFCRIQIINNIVYAENNEALVFPRASLDMFQTIIASLQRILKTQKIDNVDFIFLAVDILNPDQNIKNLLRHVPCFMMSIDLSEEVEKGCLLLPDAYLLNQLTWPPLIKQIQEGSKLYSWEDKNSEKIFWRGATTGGVYNLDSFNKLSRLQLVMMSKLYPDLIDARFTHYGQFSNDASGRNLNIILNKLFDNPGRIPEKDHLKYKYLISLDGNSAAWLRIPWILLSNSVLLKQKTSITQFFYPALKPYVHYIPIEKNISDIFEKLRWLQSHDNKAREISENATEFVYNHLMPEKIDMYLLLALKEYYKLQHFELTTPTLPCVNETFK